MADHFDSINGPVERTRLWRSSVCGSLWLDDAPMSDGDAECGCERCGGSVMEVVGWLDAKALVELAQRAALNEEHEHG